MKVAILINGNVTKKDLNFYKKEILNYDYIISADGASNWAYKAQIVPNIIIGDLDSIKDDVKNYYQNKNVEFLKFPSHKNSTDTEICIDYAIAKKASRIDLFAALGSRWDHNLGNLNMLYYALKKGVEIHFIDRLTDMFLTEKPVVLEGKKNDIVSLVPFAGNVEGVTLTGFEYPLKNFTFEMTHARGISNVMICKEARVDFSKGKLLIVKIKEED